MKHLNKYISINTSAKLDEVLTSGLFPEAQFVRYPNGLFSCSMYEHSSVVAKFSTVLHNTLIELGHSKGIFTQARSQKFQMDTKSAISGITAQMVLDQVPTFKTIGT